MIFCFGTVYSQDEELKPESVMLNSGWFMPLRGIDVSGLSPQQAENAVYLALLKGFRLIDTAEVKGNEEAVGRGIHKAIEEGLVSREDIFISAGIWIEGSETPEEAGDVVVQKALDALGLDYIDLMIVNQYRFDLDLAAYHAVERAVEEGKVRSIGLSGFGESRNYDLVVNQVDILPAVLQLETHPYLQNQDMKRHLSESGTVIEARNPLGGRDDRAVLFADPVISILATWYHKTSDQIILRWQLQSGNIFIPEATDEARLDEYQEILDFELSDSEMAEINALDRTLSYVFY
ncbi:MAG: aldo/keto reductase [Anaerolineaceae bacterium]|nr:aldo/keto reductase [Anaerolineaceae bacterium]